MVRLISFLCFAMLMASGHASALTFTKHENYNSRVNAVMALGAIEPGDRRRLAAYLDSLPSGKTATLYVGSNGGNLREAMALGRFIHSSRIKTIVQGGEDCFGACMLMLMAGRSGTSGKTWVGSSTNARVGVFSFWRRDRPNRQANRLTRLIPEIMRYGEELGVPVKSFADDLADPSGDLVIYRVSRLCEMNFWVWDTAANTWACRGGALVDVGRFSNAHASQLPTSGQQQSGQTPIIRNNPEGATTGNSPARRPTQTAAGGSPVKACIDAAGSPAYLGIDRGTDWDAIDVNQAVRVCNRAVNREPDNIELATWLGIALSKSEQGSASLRAMQPAIAAGFPPALETAGWIYLLSDDVERQPRLGVSMIRRAARAGYAPAQTSMGFLQRRGKHLERDYDKALVWIASALGSYNSKAASNIAYMFRGGQLFEKSNKQAALWFVVAHGLGQHGHAYVRDRLEGGKKFTKSEARTIQDFLKKEDYYNGPIDGDFGAGSKRALRSWASNPQNARLIVDAFLAEVR